MRFILVAALLLQLPFIGFSQSKKIVQDYNSLKKELVSLKTEAEEYAGDIKNNWKNDTLKAKGRVSYVKLVAAIDGVVESFEEVIKKPKNFTSATKAALDSDLQKIKQMLGDFSQFYTNGLVNQGGIPPETTSLVALQGSLLIGVSVFNDLKKLLQGDREEVAKQFVTECKFKRWEQL